MSGAVFLFEREATAPRSEIRKQAVSPAADAIKTSRLYGGFFNSHPEEGWRRNADGVVKNTTYAQHGLVNIAKKKRGVKSSQNQLFEEIFYYDKKIC